MPFIIKMERKKQRSIDRLNARWKNMYQKMQSLIGEFIMLEVCHQNLLKQHYDDSDIADKTNNSQQDNAEESGYTSPSPPPRRQDEPVEGGCTGNSPTPVDVSPKQKKANLNQDGGETNG